RTLLDYFTAHHVPTRAFDTETPKGTLKRFHRDVSEVVDATAVADQMRIIDTLSTTDATVTVVDVRAGLMSPTLHALRDIGFLEAVKKGQITFVVFHILGSSIASLNEICRSTLPARAVRWRCLTAFFAITGARPSSILATACSINSSK